MQELAKAFIYVAPFTILATILGLKADTNWAAIAIGVVVGIAASVFFVALRQALTVVTPTVKSVFSEPVSSPTKRQKPKTAKWLDAEGREVGQKQVEAPRPAKRQEQIEAPAVVKR